MINEVHNSEARKSNIDILRAICAFLIVCIHAPFPGETGAYFVTISRIAVPIFFMITGYFYVDIKEQHKEKNQIIKIIVLNLKSNLIFFIWDIAFHLLGKKSLIDFVQSLFSWKNLFKLFVFNESPLASHLWYLGAILYVLLIILFVDRINCRKILYAFVPILIIIDLLLGKYSLMIFHREFPFILVRNFLCVGIPFFCIGNLIREKRWNISRQRNIIMLVIFTLTGMLERFMLVNLELNATRDQYISTTFLSVYFFIFVLKSNWTNTTLAVIGRKYSTGIYILHPIFITILSVITNRLEQIKSIYDFVAPIIVYFLTLIFLIIFEKLKKTYKNWRNSCTLVTNR